MRRRHGNGAPVLQKAIWVAFALAVLLVTTRSNRAQRNELNIQFHTFQDTRSVTVLSPTVDLDKDFTDRTSLRFSFGVDAISAASDSCARCHQSGVNSRRQVAGLSLTRKLDDWKMTIGGSFSKENFYRATTALTSVSRDLRNGSTTVAGGYAFSLNQPTLHPTPQIEDQFSNDAYASVTQTLTRTTIAQAGYELASIRGYQDSPYLRTNVGGVMALGHVPDMRLRQTFSARVRQALPARTYLEADYRHYRDDWELGSNAFNIGLSHDFTSKILGSFNYRAYDQSGAFFYQPSYDAPPPQYYTGDFRLAPFASGLYSGRIVITPAESRLRLPVGTSLTFQYERYRANNGFLAGIFSTGLRIPLGTR
jgi:hypothetical protein